MLHPLVWRSVEVSFSNFKHISRTHVKIGTIYYEKGATKSASIQIVREQLRTSGFFSFFPKISSAIVDLNISVYISEANYADISKQLDAIFQIRTLQRFKCNFQSDPSTRIDLYSYTTTMVPACKDLKLLNMSPHNGVSIAPESRRTVFSVRYYRNCISCCLFCTK